MPFEAFLLIVTLIGFPFGAAYVTSDEVQYRKAQILRNYQIHDRIVEQGVAYRRLLELPQHEKKPRSTDQMEHMVWQAKFQELDWKAKQEEYEELVRIKEAERQKRIDLLNAGHKRRMLEEQRELTRYHHKVRWSRRPIEDDECDCAIGAECDHMLPYDEYPDYEEED